MEKTKRSKFLKTLGIGALTCLGMVTFAGCSIDLTQEQMDKVMYTVENADTFMYEAIDLLEKQNANLDASGAYKLYNYSVNRIIINDDGLRDNLEIVVTDNTDDIISNYKICSYSNSGDDVIISYFGADDYSVLYEDGDLSYDYNYSTDVISKDVINDIHYANNWYSFDLIGLAGLKEEDIVKCEINDNSNYEITFTSIKEVLDSEDNSIIGQLRSIYTVEVSKSAKLLTITASAGFTDYVEMVFGEQSMIINFNYDTVDIDFINEILSEAKAAEVTQA